MDYSNPQQYHPKSQIGESAPETYRSRNGLQNGSDIHLGSMFDIQTTVSGYENQIEEIKISPMFDIKYVKGLELKNKDLE